MKFSESSSLSELPDPNYIHLFFRLGTTLPSSCSVKSPGTSSDQTQAALSRFCCISLTTVKVYNPPHTCYGSQCHEQLTTRCVLMTHGQHMQRELWHLYLWYCSHTPGSDSGEKCCVLKNHCINSALGVWMNHFTLYCETWLVFGEALFLVP